MAAVLGRPPLRFHLMIGAARSGKSTAARILATSLQCAFCQELRYISSSQIRQDLYGDRAILGRWSEVEAVIHEQLLAAIAAGESVILEASYVRRAFRLAITQGLPLPEPVQWIGWWLDTPVAQCLAWNRQGPHLLPEGVIRRHCAQLLQAAPVPHRQEGFAAVVRLQTAQGVGLEELIAAELGRLDACVRRGANRDAAYRLHGYSRLLDLERLLYLIKLLSQYPKLTATNSAATEGVDGELEQLLSPLPTGGLEQKAAALLARLHGACYGDAAAVMADLQWLDQSGFSSRWLAQPELELPAIEPPPWPAGCARPCSGLPRLADREFFARVFTVLRHLLRNPHDLQSGELIAEHLAQTLGSATGQTWTARQVNAALNETLTPYGFRLPYRSGRQGYGIGAALLSLPELREVGELLTLQAEHLGDSRAAAISTALQQRLMCIDGASSAPPQRRWLLTTPPPLASRASSPRASAAAAPAASTAGAQLELIEEAIRQRQRLLLCHSRSSHGQGSQAEAVWPVQLLLHGSRWWLLIEHDRIGQPLGLLRCLELEAVHVFQREQRRGRSVERHCAAIARAQLLEQCCGGLCFGHDLPSQLALSHPPVDGARPQLAPLRLRCSPAVMADIRLELDRFQPSAVRLAAALPGDSWGRPERGSKGLRAGGDPHHPYPVEVDLPVWVLEQDQELRRWLFSYGAAIRLEAPSELVAELRCWHQEALQAYRAKGCHGDGATVKTAGLLRKGAAQRVVRKRLATKSVAMPAGGGSQQGR